MSLNWRKRAACRDADPESFFVIEHNALANQRRKERADICWDECPVRAWCLITAVTRREPWGVFGGYDMEKMTRPEKRKAARTEAVVELLMSDEIAFDEVAEALSR